MEVGTHGSRKSPYPTYCTNSENSPGPSAILKVKGPGFVFRELVSLSAGVFYVPFAKNAEGLFFLLSLAGVVFRARFLAAVGSHCSPAPDALKETSMGFNERKARAYRLAECFYLVALQLVDETADNV